MTERYLTRTDNETCSWAHEEIDGSGKVCVAEDGPNIPEPAKFAVTVNVSDPPTWFKFEMPRTCKYPSIPALVPHQWEIRFCLAALGSKAV
ncbi:MAG: hypothetical protein WBZ36_28180 [Candidatus Nitrosopolaris sp.]